MDSEMNEGRRTSLFHVSEAGGHRQSFVDMFCPMFGLSPSIGRIGLRRFWQLVCARRLMFGTLDDDLRGFIAVIVARALLGRKSCALFLRPNTCLEPGFKSRTKWGIFAILSRLPQQTLLSILPFELTPGLKNVATAYVHDPQFWDQIDADVEPDDAATQLIEDSRSGRPLMAYVGGMTPAKAFPYFAELYAGSAELQNALAVLALGSPHADCRTSVEQLKSTAALVWDRRVSDEEILSAYCTSDIIWVHYAPGYEQASGIFGRAVQWQCRVILREGSKVVAHYAQLLGHPALMLSANKATATRQLIAAAQNMRTENNGETTRHSLDMCRQWKSDFIALVTRSL